MLLEQRQSNGHNPHPAELVGRGLAEEEGVVVAVVGRCKDYEEGG